jgi:hypothetical protein
MAASAPASAPEKGYGNGWACACCIFAYAWSVFSARGSSSFYGAGADGLLLQSLSR